MRLGSVDEVEIEHELRCAKDYRKNLAITSNPERRARKLGIGEHYRTSGQEPIRHRPAWRHGAELTKDDDPRRSPNERTYPERDLDFQAHHVWCLGCTHKAAIAAANLAMSPSS